MKRCPKCNLNYSDSTLEFCLEDGARLVLLIDSDTEIPTVTIPTKSVSPTAAADTAQFPFSNPAQSAAPVMNRGAQQPAENFSAPTTFAAADTGGGGREKTVKQSEKILELSPMVIALAHNWWQWVYLKNQYYYSFSSYIFSANFLMWLLLLAAGAAIGLLALKRAENKGFTIAGLVILAINLLLFLVPKQ